ncbi:MAG: carbonic anhydrase [Acidobacteria bacterium]|nr:carbonic anhydrase [Acidobacteriota bacterium]
MSGTTLQQILAANARYRAGRTEPLDPGGPPFLILACIDPRLTSFLEPALGLPQGRAIVIRTAGNRITAQHADVLRSVAAAVYVKGASEVFVVGHTDCAMAHFPAADVIEAFRRAGVARSAFGDGDLREWFGAFSGTRENVTAAVEFLRAAAPLPRSLKVHGLILDLTDAKLEVVVDGDKATAGAAPPDSEAVKTSEPVPAAAPQPKVRPIVITGERPVVETRADEVPAPQTLMDAILGLREVLVAERKNPQMKRRLAEFSALVRREKNPSRILAGLETVLKDVRERHPQLPGILAFLRATLESRGMEGRVTEFMRRIVD